MNKPIDVSNVVLKRECLTLRAWRESDLEDLYEYASVDCVGQMAGWLPHENVDKSREILSMFIREKRTFALEYRRKVIGSLGIEEYSEKNYPELAAKRGREIGYVLSKAYWGQGLMPEAVQAVIRWLFDVEKLDFVMVAHFVWNEQSRRVIEKCGFQYVKTVQHKTRYDTIENTMEYILLRN